MTVWEFGLEKGPFAAVVIGRKTIEGRLNKGKFAEFAAGDIVNIREDYRDEHGVRHDGQIGGVQVEVVAVRKYPNFRALVEAEGVERVGSVPMTMKEAIDGYAGYYPLEDQVKYGVLAIEVRVK